MTEPTREDAAALDRDDELAAFRERFVLPDGVIYLDGNSLGPLPKATKARLAEVLEQEWGQSLIRSWTEHGWIDLQFRIGEKIGQLIGATRGTTVVTDSTSVNLFKLLASALYQRPGRKVILTEDSNFPSDLYVAQGLAALLQDGHEVRAVSDVAAAIDEQTAVEMLEELRGATVLDGVRGRPPADRAALVKVLVALGDIALDLGERLVELDINPLFALPVGALAGDALLVMR